MSLLQEWSLRLAEEVAPDEIDMAGIWGQAYAQGGKARRQLLSEAGSNLGGFGAAQMAAVLPWALKALALAGPFVLAVLSPATNTVATTEKLLDVVKNAVSVVEIQVRAGGIKRTQKAQAASAASAASPPVAASLVPKEPAYAPLFSAIERVSGELQTSGMDPVQSDALALRILKVLLTDPQGARTFVEQLGAKT